MGVGSALTGGDRLELDVSRPERWERVSGPLMSTLPYGLLTVATVLSVAMRTEVEGDLTVDLVLAGTIGAWMLWMVTLHPAWTKRRGRMQLFFTVWTVLAAVLVLRAPWFGFFSFSGYLFAGSLLHGRPQLLGVATTAIITATSQNGGLPELAVANLVVYGLLITINVCLATFFNLYGWKIAAQSEERRKALIDLAAANERLERSLEVNAELQEQLLDRAREAGMLAERQRMAGEIHDTLAQDLVGIITQLEALEQAQGAGLPAAQARRIGTAAELARDALNEARRSVQALRPTPLDDARLPEALEQVAGRWSTIHGVDASLTCHGEVRALRPELKVTMLRTAQEALANVARHAAAHRVGLTLSYMDDVVTLDIRDDGVGFDPVGTRARAIAEAAATEAVAATARGGAGPAVATGGFGLVAMRERIQGVAGTLAIESEVGHGTAVSASVPALAVGHS